MYDKVINKEHIHLPEHSMLCPSNVTSNIIHFTINFSKTWNPVHFIHKITNVLASFFPAFKIKSGDDSIFQHNHFFVYNNSISNEHFNQVTINLFINDYKTLLATLLCWLSLENIIMRNVNYLLKASQRKWDNLISRGEWIITERKSLTPFLHECLRVTEFIEAFAYYCSIATVNHSDYLLNILFVFIRLNRRYLYNFLIPFTSQYHIFSL